MSARSTAASLDPAESFGRQLYEAAELGLVRLSDPMACEGLLRSRQIHRLDLNAAHAGRREAIDLVQRAARSHGARLKACRAALVRLDAACGADTAEEMRRGVGEAREAFAAALAVPREG